MSNMATNIRKLEQAWQSGWRNVYLSSSEACMVGLAMCDSLVFERNVYSVAEAWQRVDSEQIEVICAWAVPNKWHALLNSERRRMSQIEKE